MKKFSIFAALLLSVSFCTHAATFAVPAITHPIVGKWQWTRSTNNCTEIYEYRSDGTLFVVSGAEIANATYTISEHRDATGFHELKAQPVKSNGAQDCSDSPPTGDTAPYTVYIIFHSREPIHLVCQTPALDRCFGPLRKIQP